MEKIFSRKILLMIFCLLYLPNAISQTNTKVITNGYNKFYYPNGKIASEGGMKNGKPDGYWKTYYVTGVMKSEGNRRNTLLDSTWIFYTETADTSEIINYQMGKKTGYLYTFETITEKNNISKHYLKSKELYLDDKREGQALYYYPSGKVQQSVLYKNGKKQGIAKEFDEKGTIVTLYEYHNDYMISREFVNRTNEKGVKTGVWKNFYSDGSLKEEEVYKNGILDGSSKSYSEKGNLINEKSYRDGKLIEEGIQMKVEAIELISYYADGTTLKRKGIYLDSIPIGLHIYYNAQGIPEKGIRYNEKGIRTAEGPIGDNEKRDGAWKIFYETGELRANGNYSSDRQNGEWTFYFITGKTEQVGNFRSGVIDGEWKWYYPDGKLMRSDLYSKGRLNGTSVQYSDSSTIVAKGEYIDGEPEGTWTISIGDVREEGNFLMGLKNGVWKTYYDNGKLYHKGNFVQGNPDGKHEFYFPDGTLKEEQYYVMGRRDKNWKKYYENGTLFLTITYKNDEEIRINGIRIEDIRK